VAQIVLPPGEGSERERMWTLRPHLGEAASTLNAAVYESVTLPSRLFELVRYKIAVINACPN
jgi:alkylhydroperoxidase family enzyme